MAASPSASPGHLAEAFASELQGFQLDASAFGYAVRHIPERKRFELYHKSPWISQIAIGYLYQAAIYDKIHKICDNSNEVQSFVKQFGDVLYKRRSRGSIGHNGFYYTMEGQIEVRGNGYPLAEFDGLVFGIDGSVLFVEIKKSKANLKDIIEKITYKRLLLQALLRKEADFLLIVPDGPKGAGRLKAVMEDSRNRVAITKPIPNIPAGLESKAKLREPSHSCSKATFLSDLQGLSTFDYDKIHAPMRDAILGSLSQTDNSRIDFSKTILKDVILGSLDASAVNYLLKTRQLIIGKQVLSEQEYSRRFLRALLVLDMPDGRPKLYLRVKRETKGASPNYLKFGPWSRTLFGFERNLFKKRTAFFDLLESEKMLLSWEQTAKILESYLSDAVTKKKVKIGERALW